MTSMSEDEAYAFLAEGQRTGKVATVRADGRPHVVPIWFVIDGRDISEDLETMLPASIAIGRRYMGDERGEEFGRRNAVPGELLIRLTPSRIFGETDVTA